ncbi:MAG TPA: peptidoglycan editing factor PgeF [Chloroflexia bacterium]|nr:peptidoglycan editing factor PgeF [Chloroflexia bacterium]
MPTSSGSDRNSEIEDSASGPEYRMGVDLLNLPVRDGLYHIAALERYPALLHGISTRRSPDGEDWNLSTKRGTPEYPPSVETAHANRRKFATALGISPGSIVGGQQVHGTEVALVGWGDAGRGMTPDLPSVQGVDALITGTPGLYLMALSADCPPIFFYDPVRRAIGLAHSGWKGTVGRVAANVVEAMVDNFGSSPADLVVAVGPGIGPCCYSVGSNVIEAIREAFPPQGATYPPLLEERDGLTYFNLRETIRLALLEAGLRPENITVEEVCTADNLHTFYSHRGEEGRCGLFGAVLGMRVDYDLNAKTPR